MQNLRHAHGKETHRKICEHDVFKFFVIYIGNGISFWIKDKRQERTLSENCYSCNQILYSHKTQEI